MPKRIASFLSPHERRPKGKRKMFRRMYEDDRTTTERGYGWRHQQLRGILLVREPWCRECKRSERYVPATIADHIVPLADGGARDDITNLQPLCKACSDAKTAAEAAQARRANQ